MATAFVDTNLFLAELAVKDREAADVFFNSLTSVCWRACVG